MLRHLNLRGGWIVSPAENSGYHRHETHWTNFFLRAFMLKLLNMRGGRAVKPLISVYRHHGTNSTNFFTSTRWGGALAIS